MLHFSEYFAKSLKIIRNGTIRKLGYSFLFAFHSNYGRMKQVFNVVPYFDAGYLTNGCRASIVREWRHLENLLRGRSTLLKMAPFDRQLVGHSSVLYHFRDKARHWSKIAICHTSLAFDTPVKVVSVRIQTTTWYGKTRMVWLCPTVKNVFEDMYHRFNGIPTCDGQTDEQRSCNGTVRAMYSVA